MVFILNASVNAAFVINSNIGVLAVTFSLGTSRKCAYIAGSLSWHVYFGKDDKQREKKGSLYSPTLWRENL